MLEFNISFAGQFVCKISPWLAVGHKEGKKKATIYQKRKKGFVN
jgi:hypothetical protein